MGMGLSGTGLSGNRPKWESAEVGIGRSGNRPKWESAEVGIGRSGVLLRQQTSAMSLDVPDRKYDQPRTVSRCACVRACVRVCALMRAWVWTCVQYRIHKKRQFLAVIAWFI